MWRDKYSYLNRTEYWSPERNLSKLIHKFLEFSDHRPEVLFNDDKDLIKSTLSENASATIRDLPFKLKKELHKIVSLTPIRRMSQLLVISDV